MFNKSIDELIQTLNQCRKNSSVIEMISGEIKKCIASGNKLLTAGNGGSAADALHMAEELLGRFNKERRALPAICLSADPTLITCIGNDYGFDSLFTRQIEGLGRQGDLLVVFTTSGNSKNIVNALNTARLKKIRSVALLGKNGGSASGIADYDIIVPSNTTARIQEIHTLIFHYWLECLEEDFEWLNLVQNS